MKKQWSRRDVLQTSATGVAVGLSGLSGWASAIAAPASKHEGASEETRIERLAEQIMETSPDRIVDFIIEQLKGGLSRHQLLSACFNAGARFHGHHSAYVAHPIQVVSKEVAAKESMLPLFYYLSVLRFRAKLTRMRPIDASKLPAPDRAESHLQNAMKEGDRDAAAHAVVALSRSVGPQQAYHQLWRYGAERNARSGGHSGVSLANTFRTLQATGWRCAETALRFVVGDGAVMSLPDQRAVHQINWGRTERVAELPKNWAGVVSDRGAVLELLNLYRTETRHPACEQTYKMLVDGKIQAGTVWDAVFLATTELVHRYKVPGGGNLAGHSVTSTNGLHFMFRTLTEPKLRLYSLLQAVESIISFKYRERDSLRDMDVLKIEPVDLPRESEVMEQIFSLIPPKRFASTSRFGVEDEDKAVAIAYTWAKSKSNYQEFLQTAMHMMCVKSTAEVHSFKYPMALYENCRHVSPEWRPNLLASSVHHLQGTDMEDGPIVSQAGERLGIWD